MCILNFSNIDFLIRKATRDSDDVYLEKVFHQADEENQFYLESKF